jgi:hypothetical protein
MIKRLQSLLFRLAQLRQQHDRRAQRHRERQDREPAGLLSEVLPARQRGADGGRQVRRAEDARMDRRHSFGQTAQADARAGGTLDGRADGRWRTQFVVRRKGEMQLLALAYRTPSSLHADSEASSMASEILGDTPNGRLYQALVQTGTGGTGLRLHHRRPRARLRGLRRDGQQGRIARARARQDDRSDREAAWLARRRPPANSAARRRRARPTNARWPIPEAFAVHAFRVHRARRLAAVLSMPVISSTRSSRRRSTPPRRSISCVTTAFSAPSSPTIRRSAR